MSEITAWTPLDPDRKYSQKDEETFIHRFFSERYPGAETPGFFLDIGAWSGTTFSNTRALYERGWKGVLVEPSPGPLRVLLDLYGADRECAVVGVAVLPRQQASASCGVALFQVTDDAISSSDPKHIETWKSVANYKPCYVGVVDIRVVEEMAAGRILAKGPRPTPTFASIDAEGVSVDLLNEMEWRPDLVAVEFDDRIEEVAAWAKRSGYRLAYENGLNAFLAKE